MLLAYRMLTGALSLPTRVLLFFFAISNACGSFFARSKKGFVSELPPQPSAWRRARELCGIATQARPRKIPLLWLHGVDVGEAQIALMLVQELWQKRPHLATLITTTSLPAANLVTNKSDKRLQHQFAPLDSRAWWRRFLKHWQPTLAIRCENEFWPNSIIETARHCPLLLVQARMSKKSFRRWQKISIFAKFPAKIVGKITSKKTNEGMSNQVMESITLALCQDENSSSYLKQLGVARARVVGNLKSLPAVRTTDKQSESYLARVLQRKTLWIAASTHAQEEEVVIEAHLRLLAFLPRTLCIIAPRNLKRVAAISHRIKRLITEHKAEGCSIPLQLRSHRPTQIIAPFYILDSFGELNSIYRWAPVVFVGGSLTDKGGHNFFEPAQNNCRILHGPYLRNTHAELLHKLQLTQIVENANDLSSHLRMALEKKNNPKNTSKNAKRAIEQHNKAMRADVLQYLEPYLTKLDVVANDG